MAQLEAARLLLAKARQDEYVLEQFAADAQAADETFGFHAQQAAEKLLKAALSAGGVVYPRTHRLGELLDLARDRDLAGAGGVRRVAPADAVCGGVSL